MTEYHTDNIVSLKLRPEAKTGMAASDLQRQIDRGKAMTINSPYWANMLQVHVRTAEDMQRFACDMMIAQAKFMAHFFKQVEKAFGRGPKP